MSAEIQKSITIKQLCTECQDVFFEDHVIVDLPENYNVSDIKKQLVNPTGNCPKCFKTSTASFSFIHQEKLTNGN